MQTQNTPFPLQQIIDEFGFEGEYIGYRVSNDGHINNTFVLDFKNADGSSTSYLVQLINTNVFKNPDELMENIVGVTGYLRNIVIERGGDPKRECLRVFFTKDGKPYFRAENGECWRCYNFITGAHACQSIDDPKTFFNAAKAFGTFQCLLADYPSSTLHETIPNFHNTRSRFADFKKAVGDDLKGRAAGVQEEINFVLSREGDTGILVDMLERGELLTAGHTVHCDVYTRCTKAQAIQMALRCMNPQVIVCDELGTQADLQAVEAGLACGVVFVASVHCDTLEALNRKPPTARLLAMGAFETQELLDGRVNPGHAVKVRTLA